MTALTTPPPRATALPRTNRATAAEAATGQSTAYLDQLRDLAEADWCRPTDCVLWDVRQIAAHVTGAFEEGARTGVMVRHMRAARRLAPPMAMVDALNGVQIADRRDVPGPAIVDDLEHVVAKAIRRRRRMPSVVRAMKVPGEDLPAGSTLGYLFDVIYTRDVWMHRVDTARATGRMLPPADGDEEVVAQVVRDLDRLWQGPAFVLDLTGVGAGRWQIGAGTPTTTVRADSVEFLRMLSGRPSDVELSVTGDDTVAARIRSARVAF
jgi:uncharacterized protein (TIGR03083 family)